MIAKSTKPKPASSRVDAVFIRVSSDGQDKKSQETEVRTKLKNRGVAIPQDYWFSCVVPRKDVAGNAAFNQLMDLVRQGKIGTVYIESQKRWGTDSNRELLPLLEFFSRNDTRLFDLAEGIDLACDDESTELRVILGGQSSKRERSDISRQSLRGRTGKLKENGNWPTGCQPFGYAKECFSADGRLLWRFDPISRTSGYVTDADASGKLIVQKGPKVTKIRRKDQKTQYIRLALSSKDEHVKTVQLIFSLFTRAGLSRRAIAKQLNEEGRRFYEKEFRHSDIDIILGNPAYIGDTHFGKTAAGHMHTIDPTSGEVVKQRRNAEPIRRDLGEQMIKRGTHKAIIDKKTWQLAQQRLADEKQRTNYAPRRADYYLKSVFVCGHCGKNLSGRMENGEVVYVCSTYMAKRSAGAKLTCGYHRIRHEDGEKMLFDKISEHEMDFDDAASEDARQSLKARIENAKGQDKKDFEQWQTWLEEGLKALVAYLADNYKLKRAELNRLRQVAEHFYWDNWSMPREGAKGLPITLAELRKAIEAAEAAAARDAAGNLAKAEAKHRQLTERWVLASDAQQPILKAMTDELEIEIAELKPLAVPLSERFRILAIAEQGRQQEVQQLRKEWPNLAAREKGEAFRRLFKEVVLYWDVEFVPAAEKPTRVRKTKRPGRNRYKLLHGRTVWEFTKSWSSHRQNGRPSSLASSWKKSARNRSRLRAPARRLCSSRRLSTCGRQGAASLLRIQVRGSLNCSHASARR